MYGQQQTNPSPNQENTLEQVICWHEGTNNVTITLQKLTRVVNDGEALLDSTSLKR